jgi:hypothetical protein
MLSMKRAAYVFLMAVCLHCPRATRAQEGSAIPFLLLTGAGLVLAENLGSAWIVKSSGDYSGYPVGFLPVFAYGMVGTAAAFYLGTSDDFLISLLMGSLAGNLYYLYRSHSQREFTLSLGTKSLGLGPEGFSPGLSLEFRDMRLGVFRGDIGDQSAPGPNVAGTTAGSIERITGSVYSAEADYRLRVYKNLRWLNGAGVTWATSVYTESLPEGGESYRKRTFADLYAQSGLGYTLFDRFDFDFQIGYMLLRDRYREAFLARIGSDYTRDLPVQASLKMLLRI